VIVATSLGLAVSGCAMGGSGGAATGASGASAMSQLPPGIAGKPAPRIRLSDARGGTLDTAQLRGRPYAVTFLYANCPDVCPLIAQELRQALIKLGPQASRVVIVAVSVDPHGDTRQTVQVFLKRHREPPNFHYLIGTRRELAPVWKGYYAAPQIPGDPQSAHTAIVWLVDGRGRLVGNFSAGAPLDPSQVAAAFHRLLETR
jgi:protein SCO1/2